MGYKKPIIIEDSITDAVVDKAPTSNAVFDALGLKNTLISHFEFNDTEKTVWNNGKGDVNSNTSFGDGALQSNTTGGSNTANGLNALFLNTTGGSNTANGRSSLLSNTTGNSNTANGHSSLSSNTTGSNNTSNGVDSLLLNTTGGSNTANGRNALLSNTTGNSNTANGVSSGRFISNGSTFNTNSNNSIFLGNETKALADNQTNQIVIGFGATGAGSNSVTIGNTDVTKTILRGTVEASPATDINHLVTKGQLDLKSNLAGGNNFTGNQNTLSGIVKVGDRPVATRAISFSASLNDFVIDNTTSGHSFEESSRLIAATNNASFGFYDAVPTVTSSGAISLGHLNGFQSRIRYEGAASFTNDLSAGIRSFYSDIFIAGSGNVPYTAGLYIQNATVTSTGRVENQHGIIIGNLDAGTVSNKGILCYTYRNFLQGLAIGSDVLDLDNPLRVEGNGKITGELSVGATTEYADNAAAIAGGLTIGKIYRTGDLLKIVH